MGVLLQGKTIEIKTATNELWHEFYKNYVVDPMMDMTPYTYDFERVDGAYNTRKKDESRYYFAIVRKKKVIGQIYLKHMNRQEKSTEFGIALVNDSVKGKGYGTEAIRLLLDYAFNVLNFETVLADSVLRNARSHHVLEKIGFMFTHEDFDFKYYQLTALSLLLGTS